MKRKKVKYRRGALDYVYTILSFLRDCKINNPTRSTIYYSMNTHKYRLYKVCDYLEEKGLIKYWRSPRRNIIVKITGKGLEFLTHMDAIMEFLDYDRLRDVLAKFSDKFYQQQLREMKKKEFLEWKKKRGIQ